MLNSREDVEQLERTIGQIKALHAEFSQLVKKSPNDAVNKFKLGLVNAAFSTCNSVLSEKYRPFDQFTQFDSDDVPTNSDVVLVIGQYLEQLERYRSDQVLFSQSIFKHVYMIKGKVSDIEAAPPTRIKGLK